MVQLKWSRAHCFRCLSVSAAEPVRAFLVLHFFFLPRGGGFALKRASCASRVRCRKNFLARGDAVRDFSLGLGGWLVTVHPGRRGLMVMVTAAELLQLLLPVLRRVWTRCRQPFLSAASFLSCDQVCVGGVSMRRSPSLLCSCMCMSALYTILLGSIRRMWTTHYRRCGGVRSLNLPLQ